MPGTLPFSTKSLHLNNSNSNSSSNSSSSNNINMGGTGFTKGEQQQSPPGNNSASSSAHDFSVFANVNIQGGSSAIAAASTTMLSSSQANLCNSMANNAANANELSDSLSSLPQLPKRSNSIISITNSYNTTVDTKPVLSPRSSDSSIVMPQPPSRHQSILSPKCLEPLREERSCTVSTITTTTITGNIKAMSTDLNNAIASSAAPTISPRTDKFQISHHNLNTDSNPNDRCSFQNTITATTTTTSTSQYKYGMNFKNNLHGMT